MILPTQADGYEIEWGIKLDLDTRTELARWTCRQSSGCWVESMATCLNSSTSACPWR
jgi:hypothetical protein